MIESILVPTDFSDNAYSALKYAHAIARRFGCRMLVIHAYASFRSGFQSKEANEQDRLQAEDEAQKEMEGLLQGLEDEHRASITPILFNGHLEDAISHWIKEESIDLIVMGTKGASGLKHKLMGSNAFDVSSSSAIPVIVVPLETRNFRLEQVSFFTDYANDDVETLKEINRLFGSAKSSCKLIHIHEHERQPLDTDYSILEKWAISLRKRTGVGNLSWELVHGKESAALVNEIAARNNTDLLVLTLRDKGFFEKLFDKSLAKAVVHQPNTPVLLVRPAMPGN